MADCPPFQMMPQVVPIYRPPPPAFPMPPGQSIFPMPSHFGYPPIAWSPVPHFPPPPTPYKNYHHAEDDDEFKIPEQQQPAYNNNNNESQLNENTSQRPHRPMYTRNMSNKFDTRHEEFRKFLEEMGILTTFTNILVDMYEDPLRPTDPLGYIRDKLNCSRPDTVELSNLRLWCDQYQSRTARLEKELKHVIERLRKHEPYISDDSLFNESPEDNDCKSCVMDVAKHGNKAENLKYESIKNKNE